MNSIVTDPGHARGTCVFCHGLGNASGKIEKHHGILCVFNDVRMDSLNFTMLHLKSSISLIWGSLVVSVKPRFKQCCSPLHFWWNPHFLRNTKNKMLVQLLQNNRRSSWSILDPDPHRHRGRRPCGSGSSWPGHREAEGERSPAMLSVNLP